MPKYKKYIYLSAEVYANYVKGVAEPLSKKDHNIVLETWGAVVAEHLLAGKDVKLHEGMSTLSIRKARGPKTYIDYKASKEQRRQVRAPNTISDYYKARIMWSRHYTRVFSKGWIFKPYRTLARSLAQVMKTPGGHRTYGIKTTRHGSKAAQHYRTKIL